MNRKRCLNLTQINSLKAVPCQRVCISRINNFSDRAPVPQMISRSNSTRTIRYSRRGEIRPSLESRRSKIQMQRKTCPILRKELRWIELCSLATDKMGSFQRQTLTLCLYNNLQFWGNMEIKWTDGQMKCCTLKLRNYTESWWWQIRKFRKSKKKLTNWRLIVAKLCDGSK